MRPAKWVSFFLLQNEVEKIVVKFGQIWEIEKEKPLYRVL